VVATVAVAERLTVPVRRLLIAVALVAVLSGLGFTNIDLGTVDCRPAVILPQHWTVKTQSARPGDRLAADDKIILGCARNG
jgi:hypothetical protein